MITLRKLKPPNHRHLKRHYKLVIIEQSIIGPAIVKMINIFVRLEVPFEQDKV